MAMAVDLRRMGARRRLLAIALVATPLVGAVVWGFRGGARQTDLALSSALVAVFLAVFLVLTEAVGTTNPNAKRAGFGYLEVLIGSDGYASTSKAVAWLWTVVFASALLFLSGMTWFSDLTVEKAFGDDWSSYLVLLGGPYASAVLAKGIVAGRAGDESPRTTEAASAGVVGATPDPAPDGPKVTDLATTSSGDTSLTDTQYVVFSFVAVTYFVGAFVAALVGYAGDADDIHLPPIPQALLGLTSLAALTYVGAKVVARDGMRLVSLDPDHGAGGTDVAVRVVNAPTTLTAAMVSVVFRDAQGVATSVAPGADPTRVGAITSFTVVVPGLAPGDHTVVVVTPEGSTTPTRFAVD